MLYKGATDRTNAMTHTLALAWARGTTILVLDQKDVSVAVRVRKIAEHKAEACAILIVNNFQDARACYALNRTS